MVLLPSELYIKIASYLEPTDLKSYSIVSRQIRTCALECLVFDTRDSETIQRAINAGARKLRLTCNTVDTAVVQQQPTKIVELIFEKIEKIERVIAVDLNVFKNLTVLKISKLRLTELPILPPTLVTLDCSKNQLTQLPTLPSNLTVLNISKLRLIELPILPPTLVTLDCSYNVLTQLPTLPSNLTVLNISKLRLTELPILPQTLVTLDRTMY